MTKKQLANKERKIMSKDQQILNSNKEEDMQTAKIREKGKRTLALLFVTCYLLFVLASCPNIFTPESEAPLPGYGYFSIQMDENAARTILPQTVLANFLAYRLVFTNRDDPSDVVTVDRTNSDYTNPVTLRVGTWNLVVTAYMDAARTLPAATGSLDGIIIIAAGTTSGGAVTLNAIITGTGTGSFYWNIEHPANVTVTITITPRAGTTASDIIIPNAAKTGTRNDIPVGQYTVVFKLELDNHRTVNLPQIMYVYQNMTSRFPDTGSFNFTNYFLSDYFDITFDSNGGTNFSDLSVPVMFGKTFAEAVTDLVTDLADYVPTRVNYIFDGWYTEDALTNPFSINAPVNRDIILYAKWASLSNITGEETTEYGDPKGTLTFDPALSLSGMPSYQWEYSANDTDWTSLGTGATSASYTPPADLDIGNHYYRCVVSNSSLNGGLTATATSNMATITVIQLTRVASVSIGGETKNFETLADAFDSVEESETAIITLLQDIELDAPITLSTDRTITLTSGDSVRSISYAGSYTGNLFTVTAGNFTLQGGSGTNTLTLNAGTGIAINSASSGKITVLNGASITSANTQAGQGTILLTGTDTGVRLQIDGGTVQNTANNASARAIYNDTTGGIEINGGIVQATAANAYAIYNNNTGELTVSDGTVQATTGRAIHNEAAGTITVNSGTVQATTGRAIHNEAAGTVTVSGGTVSATTGRAIHNQGEGTINVDGGKVTVTTGRAIHNENANGTVNITGSSEVIAGTPDTGYSIYNVSTGTITIGVEVNQETQIIGRKFPSAMLIIDETEIEINFTTLDDIINNSIGNNTTATIELTEDIQGRFVLDSAIGKNVTITSKGGPRTIRRSTGLTVNDGLFEISSGVTLTLEGESAANSLTLIGGNASNGGAAVIVNSGGKLIMENNVTVQESTGAIRVASGGEFEMKGGSITNNLFVSNNARGVLVQGKFTMSGGEIKNNNRNTNGTIGAATGSRGGGVFVDITGDFEMSGGTISGNSAYRGGGVYIEDGKFNMGSGAVIENNTALDDAANPRGGGGVYLAGTGTNNPTFALNGGIIRGNSAPRGGGVLISAGTFTMNSGSIEQNTANIGGGLYWINDGGGSIPKFVMGGGTIYGTNNSEKTNTASDGLTAAASLTTGNDCTWGNGTTAIGSSQINTTINGGNPGTISSP